MLPKMSKFVILIWLMCISTTHAGDCPHVSVEQGMLKGSYMMTTKGRQFSAFRGIPYAKPPLGNLRFKAPLTADPWNGTYDASRDAQMCPQVRNVSERQIYYGDENCLTLSVYTHMTTRKLPVLVYLHGGSLMSGSVQSTEYPPERLMNQPIVFVLPQYRLSGLGFMSTGDAVSSGNYGLLDQAEALNWVKKNIQKFGGDPKRVILGGASAGGASAGYHLVSPLTRGLFIATISQSGPTLANIAVETDPLPIAKRLGARLNCNSNITNILVDCLRNKSAQQIVKAWAMDQLIAAPVVEDPKYGNFVFDTPTKLFQEGQFAKVPQIIGTVKDEGAIVVVIQFFESLPVITDTMLDYLFNVLLPPLIQLGTGYETNLLNLSYAVRQDYGKTYDFYDKKQLTKFVIDIISDMVFIAPAAKQASLVAAHNVSTYLYSFEYEGDLSTTSYFGEKAVGHGDDVRYMLFPNQTASDSKYSDQFGTIISNFIHFLNPTPKNKPTKWIPTPAADKLWYLQFGNESIAMKEGYFTDRVHFWNVKAPTIVGNTTHSNHSMVQLPGLPFFGITL